MKHNYKLQLVNSYRMQKFKIFAYKNTQKMLGGAFICLHCGSITYSAGEFSLSNVCPTCIKAVSVLPLTKSEVDITKSRLELFEPYIIWSFGPENGEYEHMALYWEVYKNRHDYKTGQFSWDKMVENYRRKNRDKLTNSVSGEKKCVVPLTVAQTVQK